MLDEVPLEELVRYIDWTFFFSAWELKGKFPGILEHPRYGEAARDLYEQGREVLARISRLHSTSPVAATKRWTRPSYVLT